MKENRYPYDQSTHRIAAHCLILPFWTQTIQQPRRKMYLCSLYEYAIRIIFLVWMENTIGKTVSNHVRKHFSFSQQVKLAYIMLICKFWIYKWELRNTKSYNIACIIPYLMYLPLKVAVHVYTTIVDSKMTLAMTLDYTQVHSSSWLVH